MSNNTNKKKVQKEFWFKNLPFGSEVEETSIPHQKNKI